MPHRADQIRAPAWPSSAHQRMLSRRRLPSISDLRIFEILHSEAFTTRLPLTVSCRIWLTRQSVFLASLRGVPIFLPNLPNGRTPRKHDARRPGSSSNRVKHHVRKR